jgi:hypothetical protein
MQKSELLMTQFEECMLVIEINKEPRHRRLIAEHLVRCQTKLNNLCAMLEYRPPSRLPSMQAI